MMNNAHDWLRFLRDSGAVAAIPLVVGGMALMLFGYRLWKLTVFLSFGLIGGGVVCYFVGDVRENWNAVMVGAIVLACVGLAPVKVTVALLGGAVSGCVTAFLLTEFTRLSVGTALSIVAVALIAAVAYSVLHRRNVVIFVTAFLGTSLSLSGMTALAMSSRSWYATIQAMGQYSAIVVPFVILVPTVMSCFYQSSEVRKQNLRF